MVRYVVLSIVIISAGMAGSIFGSLLAGTHDDKTIAESVEILRKKLRWKSIDKLR